MKNGNDGQNAPEKVWAHCPGGQGENRRVDEEQSCVRYRRRRGVEASLWATAIMRAARKVMVTLLRSLGRAIAPSVTVDQNVSFYEEQIQLFTAVYGNAIHSVQTAEKDLRAQRGQVAELRERIRDIRETLVSASSSPSIEAISERIRLQERIGRVETQQQMFDENIAELAQLASEWLDVQERLRRLPKGALSERDEAKINTLQNSFQQQLKQYKMGSLAVAEVRISPGSYEPEVAGVNLSADVSASDLIRLHWAYLLGLLEVGTKPTGNHPGLLILDEPQQQSVEETSFREMLRHAQGEKDCQIIITTSHERKTIGAYLEKIGTKHVVEFGTERILQKMSS